MPFAQRAVGEPLLGGVERHVDVQAARVGVVAVLGEDQLAHRLGYVLGVHRRPRRGAVAELLLACAASRCCVGDEAVLEHAIDDVAAGASGPRGLAIGLLAEGALGRPGEHRGLGDGDVVQRLAEVDLAGRAKP